ncbi:MAG: acyl-CoA-binding protein [Acidobacteria bacterium]|nr:acyl-CoA-binding protein [Acidobacteriota bacterium]
MDLLARFEEAARRAKALGDQSNETLLELYALYKQATAGDVPGKRPGMFDPVGRAKFDAWSGKAGMSREEAMESYVELVDRLAGS